MPYPAAEVSGMKDPKPPTLLRLKPIIANAQYQDALNLEGLETVIPTERRRPHLSLPKFRFQLPAIAKERGKDLQTAVSSRLGRASHILSFAPPGIALKENPEETPSTEPACAD